MKFLKKNAPLKNGKEIIIYYTIFQLILGAVLITLQLILFFQVIGLLRNCETRLGSCNCSGMEGFESMENKKTNPNGTGTMLVDPDFLD